jgi:BON domain
MRIYRRSISIALFTALLGLSIACSKDPSDDKISKDIQDKVAADQDTKDSQVNVTTKDRKVTLTGKAKTSAAQKKAEQFAREEPGAAEVDDETMIEAEGASSAEQAPAVQKAQPQPQPKPKPQPVVVPAGTTLTVRVGETLSSKTSQAGQTFLATLAQPVSTVSAGKMVSIPAGSAVSGTVVSAKSKGKFKGEAELSLALTSVTVNGHTYPIHTTALSSTSKGKGKRTAATTGGGAAGGALIGGLAGGGKGAGIGALVGAGAGLMGGAMTGNQQIEVPAESALSFQLSAPLTLPPPSE